MKEEFKKQIIEALKNQKEIFGDDLFEENLIKRKTTMVAEKKEKYTVEPELFPEEKEEWEKAETLEKLESLIKDCTACKLFEGRNKFVFGSGNPNADVMCVGEGPGAEEDKQGLPFVGRAGQLLTDILKAIKFERDEVYIANIVKCRPPDNRTPFPDEMDTCLPYLRKQYELIQPKLILCLGLTAAKGLLKTRESLTSMRGKLYEFEDAKVMVTYHPAALLRNPNWKRPCWEDLKKFKQLHDELVS
jgi:uracil-DNA glycosylase family 4